jgi:hypothetical protein
MPSLERLGEPLRPSELLRDDELLLALRLEPEEPDEAFMPRSLELEELEDPDDEPLFDALKPPWPERSCELLNPEFVLPDAPRPSFRLEGLLLLLVLPALLLSLRLLVPAAL